LDFKGVNDHVVNWLSKYAENAKMNGFIIGISGGVDSAVTSMLCAQTGKKVLALSMPIRQTVAEFQRANEHIENLKARFSNIESIDLNLTETFGAFEAILPQQTAQNFLAMANSRSRLRMMTLYAVGQSNGLLVAGTGNKIEDFGVGFFTKYGDGGVDISPIADLTKTEVFGLAKYLGIVNSIQIAKPTDGLWEDGRSDEDQIGATYPELEWAMDFNGDENSLTEREKEVLVIYRRFNKVNKHKMEAIPVCEIPSNLKK
jgi:NAD+ synthase